MKKTLLPALMLVTILALSLSWFAGCEGGSSIGASPTPTPGSGLLYVSNNGANSVLGFHSASSLNGNTAPNTNLTGGATGATSPRHVTVSTASNNLFVTSATTNTIVIFANANTATGNQAPNRKLTGVATQLSYPYGIYLDATNNVLYVTNYTANSVTIYNNAGTIDGAVAPTRHVTGLITSPTGVAVDVNRNVLYVALHDTNTIAVWDDANTVNGPTPPTRTLVGPATLLTQPDGLYMDSANNVLYVASRGGNSVLMFANANIANGNVAPTRSLFGDQTGLNAPADLFVANNQLYVGNYGNNSVRVFSNATTTTGNVTPARTLSGANTTFNGPSGIFVDSTRSN